MSAMRSSSSNSQGVSLTAFTVCAGEELASLVASVSTYVPGMEFAGDVPAYISVQRRPHFPSSFKQSDSCVAFIDFDKDWDRAIETVEALTHVTEPRITSVGISERVDTEGLLVAMRAGCSEVLRKPVQLPHLQQCIEHWQQRAASASQLRQRSGRVIACYGTKGGVGTTTVLVHLALELACRGDSKVLLIDYRRQLGHAALYLGLKENQYGFIDLVRSLDRLDSDLLQGFVTSHPSGLHVLASPTIDTSANSYCSSAQMEQILHLLRAQYDLILVDAGIPDRDTAGTLMQLADATYIFTTAEIAAIRDLTCHIDFIAQNVSPSEKAEVILNRAVARSAITAEEIAKAIGRPIAFSIPEFPPVAQAVGTGEPFSAKKRNDLTKAIAALAQQIAPAEVRTGHSKPKKLFGLLG